MKASELKAALAWPTEAKPEPLPFRWVDHDRLRGTAREGVFWSPISESAVHIKLNNGKHGNGYSQWAFSRDGENWNTNVMRGPLFESKYDAQLYELWGRFERSAEEILRMRRVMK